MKRVVTATVLCLVATPLLAANPKVDAAVKTFAAIEADAAKLETFCKMQKAMTGGEGEMTEAQEEAMGKEIDGYMKSLGTDFVTAYEAGGDIDTESADGKAYEAAVQKLEGKCK